MGAVSGGAGGTTTRKAQVMEERAQQFFLAATAGGEEALTLRRMVEYCLEVGLVGEAEEAALSGLFDLFDAEHHQALDYSEFLVSFPMHARARCLLRVLTRAVLPGRS
eukprot:739972-Rhodomonas_salina.3